MKKVFETTNIENVKLRNRLIRSATWENLADNEGHMTNELFRVYERLSRGKLGLVITGYANVVKEEKANPGMMGIYDDSFIGEYKKLTDMMKNEDTPIIMQIAYGGTKTKYNVGERTIFAPSDVPEKQTKTLGKTMTKEDIDYIVSAFAKAAVRAESGGFSGVEIHAAHSYLINQFLSPYYNKRKDKYGGSLQNRARFLLEIYDAIRKETKFPVFVKLTATDFFEGGLPFTDTLEIAKMLDERGVSAIELSGNIHGKGEKEKGNTYEGYTIENEGYFINFAKVVAEEVKAPVITVGGIKTVDALDAAVRETEIEYFALARPLLTEPELVKEWEEGRRTPVRCIRCSKCRTPSGNYCTHFNVR